MLHLFIGLILGVILGASVMFFLLCWGFNEIDKRVNGKLFELIKNN